jgi:hypothetical protein
MGQKINRSLIPFLALTLGCYASQQSACGSGPTPLPEASPSPTASPSPSASASTTPTNPCGPVIGVNAAGPNTVQIGSLIAFDVTPVSPAGPLEGALDYCNAARTVTPENVSANLRQVGSSSSFRPQFLAVATGPFCVSFRVEGAVSQPFCGTVVP